MTVLLELGGVVSDVSGVATGLLLVGPILSVFGIAANSMGLFRTGRCLRKMMETRESGGESESARVVKTLEKLVEEDDVCLVSHFRTGKADNVRDPARRAIASVAAGEEDSIERADKLINTLKGRARSKIRSHKVKIVAGIISLIGLAILLFTPAAPLGYALIAACALISLSTLFYDMHQKRKPIEFSSKTADSVSKEKLLKEEMVETSRSDDLYAQQM